jgi:hypothetical protein
VSSPAIPTTGGESADTAPVALLALTWAFVETYRHEVPLADVAAALGRTVEEIAADPASLLGVAGDRLADLVTGHQAADRTVGVPEVEILQADFDATPTLADLVETARAALRTESGTEPSPTGRALAALLAGLAREDISQR